MPEVHGKQGISGVACPSATEGFQEGCLEETHMIRCIGMTGPDRAGPPGKATAVPACFTHVTLLMTDAGVQCERRSGESLDRTG